MLVRVKTGVTLSGAEQEFVDCLRKFPTTALALIDVQVGDSRGTRQVDAVILTPRGLTVIEVRGFRRRQSGILNVSADGPWTISDAPADLDDDSPASPSDQLEQSVFEVKSMLERALLDPGHICGAVVLVPFRGVVVRPARTNLRPGLDVVVGNVPDSTEMRIYLEGFSAGPRNWTADRVVNACKALGLTDGAPTREELVADGFETVAPEQPSAIARPVPPREQPVPGPASRGQNIAAWVVVAIAVLGMLAVLGVIVMAVVRDSDPPPAGPATPTVTADPSVPPATSTQCWPFQPNC